MHALSGQQSQAAMVLEDCRDLVTKQLQPRLDKLFENSNTAFLEFAEKAQTGSSQIRFMEAMTVVQKDRSRIEEIFYREIGKSFSGFGTTTRSGKAGMFFDHETLSLQSKEDADIEVAVRNMAGSATLGSTLTIGAILQRLAVLNHGRKLQEMDIPGGPSCLARAFHAAVRDMALDHEIRLIVYLLFNRFVLSNTRLLYEEYNKRLLHAGLLPHLKYEVQRNPASATVPGPRRNTASRTGHQARQNRSLSDELFDSVLDLIAQRNQHTDGRPGTNAEPQDPLPQHEVVDAIQQLQYTRQQDAIEAVRSVTGLSAVDQHSRLVSTLLQRITTEREQLFLGIDRRRLPSADTQVIDLVGMMIEYMLRDENLPSMAKAELSRLHTPYLKIAIVDKSLFTDNSHPAHKLLNELALAGTRWVFEDSPERGIFPCIRQIVQRIIEEFENNLEIFTELLQLLHSNLKELENKAVAIEERSRQAATGREKLEQARSCAANAIESMVSNHQVPAELRKLLGDVWLDKLMFIYLREAGSDSSPSWKLAIRAIETIIWSVQPRTDETTRNELADRLPEIRTQTRQAMEMLDAYGRSDHGTQLALIHHLQDMAIAAVQEQELCQDVTKDIAGISADTRPEPVTATRATVPEPDQHKEHEAEAITLTPAEAAALAALEQVSFGTWFAIRTDRQQLPVHLKLSWYSGISGNYMFVNSMGVKVLMIRHHELASMLVSGAATIMTHEQQPFIQRTLHMIRQMLGGDRQRKSGQERE
jgi:hypothetical protein